MSHIYLSTSLKCCVLTCFLFSFAKTRPITSVLVNSYYPRQDFLVPLSLCSSNEKNCTSMSVQCSALHRRALLAESLWQLQRLAGNWIRLPSSSLVKSDGFDLLGASRGHLCRSPLSMLHWTETVYTHSPVGPWDASYQCYEETPRINLSVTWPGSGWRDIFHSWVHLASMDRRLRLKCLLVCFSATLWFTGTASKTFMFWHELLHVNSDVWWISSHRAIEYRLENPCKQPLEDACFLHWHWIPVLFSAHFSFPWILTTGCTDGE